MLRSIEANAMTPRKRVVFFVSGNGFLTSRYPPELLVNGRVPKTESIAVRPFSTLAPPMAPLQKYVTKITLVDGLWHGVGGGHWKGYPALTCAPGGAEGVQSPAAASIDSLIAKANAQGASLPHVALAVTQDRPEFVRGLVAEGPGKQVVMRANPLSTLAYLFGPTDATSRDDIARRGQVLDWLKEDVARVQRRLSGPERLKFDAYLASIEYLQATQASLVRSQGSCRAPSMGSSFTIDQIEGRCQSMVAIAATALACGITNAVTLSLNALGSFGATYAGLGYTVGLHGLGHGGTDPVNGRGDGTIQRFHAEAIASFCDVLAAVPEGSGSVLDQTLVVWLNENGPSHHSRPWHPWNVMLLGTAQGALKPGGRVVHYPHSEHNPELANGRRVADLYRTIAKAMGVTLDQFGYGAAQSVHGPLAELLV
jgi:hypothetical protein